MGDEKLHWFCFSYAGTLANSTKGCSASSYTGYPDKKITFKRVNENKIYAKVTPDSVLMGVSYLGHMTEEEFKS